MVNKRGWIRIVEASFAILLIFSALLLVNRQQNVVEEEDLSLKARDILDEMLRQDVYREIFLNRDISNGAKGYVKNIIDENVYDFEFRICNREEVCSLENYPTNAKEGIYGAERIISGSKESGLNEPIIVKLFIWRVS